MTFFGIQSATLSPCASAALTAVAESSTCSSFNRSLHVLTLMLPKLIACWLGLDLEQLREVYNIKIKTYANVNTFPGTYIFLDPRGFAPDMTVLDDEVTDLTRFGIGGYHMITKSTHKFGIGVAESEIIAKWVAQIDFEEEYKYSTDYNAELKL